MKYYKFLNEDGMTPHGRDAWPMPQRGKPGAWTPRLKGDIVLCLNGYHIIKADQLIPWMAAVLWEVEVRGTLVEDSEKCAARQARLICQVEAWNERTARLFAADSAEHVLPIYEEAYPDDSRPRKAIEAARLFAAGSITAEELRRAWDAAGAAWDAAGAAARDAARAAAGAAGAAARDAAWDAAWAAGDAAGAAWDAAGDAARAAAGDAWDAAWDAAWAAWAAAWAAARDAEQKWQAKRLIGMLGLEDNR